MTERHGTLRSFLLGVFLLASVGTGAELLLLEHTEGWEQQIPLVLLAAGAGAGTAAAARPGGGILRAFRLLMATFVAAGLAGLYLHYRGNVEFELEMYPSLGGVELFWEAIRGATPALAPATMIWLGLLGLAFSYDHPALRQSDGP